MKQTRRGFLELFVPGRARAATAKDAVHYAMVIDLRRCVGCQACSIACSMENRLPDRQWRTSVSDYEVTIADRPRRSPLPRLCNHCEKPACVSACPTGATFKRDDGLVVVDSEVCVGCAYCVQNCPYDGRFMNEQTRTADKCTFCIQRLQSGLLPACVESCVGKARVFGDLSDPDSAVARLVRDNPAQVLKSTMGTHPQVFYLALDSQLQNRVKAQAAPFTHGAGYGKEA